MKFGEMVELGQQESNMFDKASVEYASSFIENENCDYRFSKVKQIWQDGAAFGYNKATEWHYPSKGEYPEEYEDVLICFLTEDDMKDCVRGWYEYDYDNDKHIFKHLNVLGTQYLETVIAWKEFVLPELRGKLWKA